MVAEKIKKIVMNSLHLEYLRPYVLDIHDGDGDGNIKIDFTELSILITKNTLVFIFKKIRGHNFDLISTTTKHSGFSIPMKDLNDFRLEINLIDQLVRLKNNVEREESFIKINFKSLQNEDVLNSAIIRLGERFDINSLYDFYRLFDDLISYTNKQKQLNNVKF